MPISYVVSGFYKALFYSEKIEGEIQEDAIVNNNIFKMIFGKHESLLATVQKKCIFGDFTSAGTKVMNSLLQHLSRTLFLKYLTFPHLV